jgi:hypothetical protein
MPEEEAPVAACRMELRSIEEAEVVEEDRRELRAETELIGRSFSETQAALYCQRMIAFGPQHSIGTFCWRIQAVEKEKSGNAG